MPRFAYIPYIEEYQQKFPNSIKDDFQDKFVLKVDSTTFTDEENKILKNKLKDSIYCYSCDSSMYFRKQNGRHNHFVHTNKKDCFEAESLAHASVKRNLYERFKSRGYEVFAERVFKSKRKQVRTDVAVIKNKDVLAIEVQASPTIKCSTIAERTNTYSEVGIPTAWVIVLDSFFGEGNFTYTKEQVLVQYEDGTSSYEERVLPFSVPSPFVVKGAIPKSFYYIMDTYKYVVAVNHEGHFFIIRKTDVLEESLEIFRMQQELVVDSLLATDIKSMEYEAAKNNEEYSYELKHTEGIHTIEKEFSGEDILKELGTEIDFKTAHDEELEQLKDEQPLDILQIIDETKKRDKLYAKKQYILNNIEEQLSALMDEKKKVDKTYEELNELLNVLRNKLLEPQEESKAKEEHQNNVENHNYVHKQRYRNHKASKVYSGGEILKKLGVNLKIASEEGHVQYAVPLENVPGISETEKSEILYAKKHYILEGLEDQLNSLMKEVQRVDKIYDELNELQINQYEKIELHEKKNNEVAGIKIKDENLTQTGTSQGDSIGRVEGIFQHNLKTLKPMKQILLSMVKEMLSERKLEQLSPYTTKGSPYLADSLLSFISERLKKKIKDLTGIDINDIYGSYNIASIEVGLILNEVIDLKVKEGREIMKLHNQEKKEVETLEEKALKNIKLQEELSRENQFKDNLCAEIEKMQSETGLNIVKDVNLLRRRNIQTIKNAHKSVKVDYERMTQLSLF